MSKTDIIIPSIIHKRFNEPKYRPVNKMGMRGFEWFALVDNYGTEYGNLLKSYRFKKRPNLLNIGNGNVRTMIEDRIEDPDLINACHPDEQYSGIRGNQKYHQILKKYFGDEYDGTIIDQSQLEGNLKYPKEELEGPSEIVIWKDYDELLEELPSNKGGNKNKKKRKSKKRSRNKKRTNKRVF